MKKQTVKKIIMYVLIVMMSLILMINVITACLSVTGLRERLGWLPFAVLKVEGGSMEPELSEGDLIIIKETDYSELVIGDDVTFLTTDGFVTHRIVGSDAEGFITRGLANNRDDLEPMRREAYCGRVVAALPLMGYILQFINEAYIIVLLCAVVISGILICLPYIRRRAECSNDKAAFPKKGALVCISVLSFLLSLPFVTQAKYVGEVNRFDIAVAQPVYFTSNYLSPEGNTYSIQGWNGMPYTLSLQIRNYSNSLLYNQDNTPNDGKDDLFVEYGFGVRMITGEEYSDEYKITITPDKVNYPSDPDAPLAAIPAVDEFIYPEGWVNAAGDTGNKIVKYGAYSLSGGNMLYHTFSITITPTPNEGGGVLEAKKKIAFEIFAVTQEEETYAIQLGGKFSLTVAEGTEFIGKTLVTDLPSMATVSIETNLISDGGSDEKVVLIRWDPDKLYINEFESTVFNIITHSPTYLDRENGRLYIKMQAYSSAKLEFFKKVSFEAGDDDIMVDVVSHVGDLPENGESIT